MGVSTVAIGMLPTYATIGVAAPLLLALCRFGQGLGLGGEWGGAVLLAIENAPPGKRAWYGMFPQLGAPIGFLFSGSSSSRCRSGSPTISSSPSAGACRFSRARRSSRRALRAADDHRDAGVPQAARRERAREGADARRLPRSPGTLVLGTLASIETFVLFYLMTVFTLSWGTTALGYTRNSSC